MTSFPSSSRWIRRTFRIFACYPAVWLWPLSLCVSLLGAKSQWGRQGVYNEILVFYYIPALILALLGCFPRFRLGPPLSSRAEETFLPRGLLRGLTIAILVFAGLLRVWWVWYWPPPGGLAYEEAQLAGTGWTFLQSWIHPPDDRLSVYAIALSFKVFGPGIFAARLPFMVAGLLCPALLLAVCRKLVSWEVSLFSVLLFSVSWWVLATSRLADEIFFVIVFELMIMWLLLHFMDTGRLWAAFFLALISGLFIYEHTSYNLVPFLVLGYLVIAGIAKVARLDMGSAGRFCWQELRSSICTYGPGFLLIMVVWTTTFMPRIVGDVSLGDHNFGEALYRHEESGGGLSHEKIADAPALVVKGLKRTLQAAYKPGQGDWVPWLSVEAHPMFDRATVLAGAVSLVLITLTFWRRFHAFMLFWIFIPLIIGSAFAGNFWISRFYMILPPFYVAIALGGGVLWGWSRRRYWRWLLLFVFCVVGLCAVAANLNHFFVKVCRDPDVRRAFDDPPVVLGDWIGHRERDSMTWLVTHEYLQVTQHQDLTWLLRQRQARSTESIEKCASHPIRVSGPTYYVIVPVEEQEKAEDLIHRHYPDAESMEPFRIRGERTGTRVSVFRVPALPHSEPPTTTP